MYLYEFFFPTSYETPCIYVCVSRPLGERESSSNRGKYSRNLSVQEEYIYTESRCENVSLGKCLSGGRLFLLRDKTAQWDVVIAGSVFVSFSRGRLFTSDDVSQPFFPRKKIIPPPTRETTSPRERATRLLSS